MSRDAVKFGRMSKKQREKVEDEVKVALHFPFSLRFLSKNSISQKLHGIVDFDEFHFISFVLSNAFGNICGVFVSIQPNNG